MIHARSAPKINCPLGIFSDHEREIRRLNEALNQATNSAVKAAVAEQLRDETESLLSCVGYQEDNANCRLCREFSRLRNQTATLVVAAAKLAG